MDQQTGNVISKVASLPRLATWMVKAGLPEDVQSEAVAAFKDEFEDRIANHGKKSARRWAMKTGWETFYSYFETLINFIMVLFGVLGFFLAIISIVIAI